MTENKSTISEKNYYAKHELDSLKQTFYDWKINNNISKAFFSYLNNAIDSQTRALLHVYITKNDADTKLIYMGAHSHVIRFLKGILNIEFNDLKEELSKLIK